jgi:hypothetical protein
MLSYIWVSAGTIGTGTDNAQSCSAPGRSSPRSTSHLAKIPYLIAASVEQQFTTAKVYRV